MKRHKLVGYEHDTGDLTTLCVEYKEGFIQCRYSRRLSDEEAEKEFKLLEERFGDLYRKKDIEE